jgi:hypothetical protein
MKVKSGTVNKPSVQTMVRLVVQLASMILKKDVKLKLLVGYPKSIGVRV